ncbi:MAG: thymidine phosphorylase [Bacteroidota bacterium]|jgi:pyrimidine-nucleoside phosphorylase|nr:thymidine phosphorylase [Ignavibacteria bacterium]MCU7500194.1 thymidine phosphorylase [Ignavibacteria bacterium]MCU7513854.1 thymidine phosphorylase [Ignavibacteria bacterium]MCU7521556.1 thymidine phosphorylase [Ignavibacteria bacterium]MCU7525010.1 thymidine phosphorylase [Ignavibacteria bacterium]
MNTVELIRKKRNGEELSEVEIGFLIKSYIKNKIPDYQFSALLMAIFFNGMTTGETAALTKAMLYSGKVIDLKPIPGVKIDKHSTGGVGDKTSLILAPIAAAAGIKVPMISGRGLGHTGGTLDKLEAIPGFRTDLSLSQYKSVIKKCGTVLIGQTKDIAPADKLIYALRDVTATVESIPLITSSIMSKKLAEGIDGLVLDIKTGSGAFMREQKEARKLAEALINTAKAFDKKVIGFITDMNQPLGRYIGNWLEVYESIRVLQGEKSDDLMEVTHSLTGAMIYLGGKASSIEEGVEVSREMITSGKAFEKLIEIVKLQGGDINLVKNPGKYPKPRIVETVTAPKSGYFNAIDNFALGMVSLELGAGRMTKEDVIDPKAGIVFYPKLGDRINKGDVIAEFHTDRKNKIEDMKNKLYNIISIDEKKKAKPKLIKEILM